MEVRLGLAITVASIFAGATNMVMAGNIKLSPWGGQRTEEMKVFSIKKS